MGESYYEVTLYSGSAGCHRVVLFVPVLFLSPDSGFVFGFLPRIQPQFSLEVIIVVALELRQLTWQLWQKQSRLLVLVLQLCSGYSLSNEAG